MVFNFTNNRKGFGFGIGMPGFNRGKIGTLSSGNWDLDRKPNRGDCDPFNWRKQDGGEPFKDRDCTCGRKSYCLVHDREEDADSIIKSSMLSEEDQADLNISKLWGRKK